MKEEWKRGQREGGKEGNVGRNEGDGREEGAERGPSLPCAPSIPPSTFSPGVKNGGRGRERKYERREELYPTTGLYLHMIFTANTRASLIPGSLEPRPRSLGTRLNTVMLYGAHLFCLFHAKP